METEKNLIFSTLPKYPDCDPPRLDGHAPKSHRTHTKKISPFLFYFSKIVRSLHTQHGTTYFLDESSPFRHFCFFGLFFPSGVLFWKRLELVSLGVNETLCRGQVLLCLEKSSDIDEFVRSSGSVLLDPDVLCPSVHGRWCLGAVDELLNQLDCWWTYRGWMGYCCLRLCRTFCLPRLGTGRSVKSVRLVEMPWSLLQLHALNVLFHC